MRNLDYVSANPIATPVVAAFAITIAVTLGSLAGCGESSPPTPPAPTTTTTPKSTVTKDDGKPPARTKIPSDDLFATLVQAFVENKGDLYGETDKKLDDMGANGIPTYVDALTGGGIDSRKLACIKLANLGPAAAPATAALAVALDDEDASVRANAASVLSILPQPPANLVAKLTETLNDKSADMWHSMSIVALSNLGTVASDAVPSLAPFLKSDDAELRRDTVRTLKLIGPAAKDLLPDIQELVNDENEDVSAVAKEAVAFLESIDADPGPDMDRATEQVGQANDGPPNDTPPLIPELSPPKPEGDDVPELNPEPAAPAVPKAADKENFDEPLDEE